MVLPGSIACSLWPSRRRKICEVEGLRISLVPLLCARVRAGSVARKRACSRFVEGGRGSRRGCLPLAACTSSERLRSGGCYPVGGRCSQRAPTKSGQSRRKGVNAGWAFIRRRLVFCRGDLLVSPGSNAVEVVASRRRPGSKELIQG